MKSLIFLLTLLLPIAANAQLKFVAVPEGTTEVTFGGGGASVFTNAGSVSITTNAITYIGGTNSIAIGQVGTSGYARILSGEILIGAGAYSFCDTTAQMSCNVAIGNNAGCRYTGNGAANPSTAVGCGARVDDYDGSSFGSYAVAGRYGTAVGNSSFADSSGTAIGNLARGSGVSIGKSSSSGTAIPTVAIGVYASADSQAVSIGGSSSSAVYSESLGAGAYSRNGGIAVGFYSRSVAKDTDYNSMALGLRTYAGTNAISIGTYVTNAVSGTMLVGNRNTNWFLAGSCTGFVNASFFALSTTNGTFSFFTDVDGDGTLEHRGTGTKENRP